MSQRLKLFGGIGIETEDGPLTGRAVQRRRLALLALLATARSRGISRDRLIAFLWPEADAENGRRFLSDSVYRVNQALGGDVIVAAGDELRLDPERLPSDLAAFEDAIAARDSETAVRVYGGPFLDGFHLPDSAEFERWIDTERSRRGREFAAALERLAESAEREGDAAAAVSWWRRLATLDPCNGRVATRLMRALDAAGERAAAIQHARIHEALLRSELEIGPSDEVQEFAEALRRGCPRTVFASERAMVAATPVEAAGLDELAIPVRLSRRRRIRLTTSGIVAMLAVLVLAMAVLLRDAVNARAARADSSRTIAVLPFANLSGADDEYLVDGITEELIGTLARIPGIRVASRTSVFAFKNRPVDVRELGERLGAGSVIEGSVRRSGNQLRITARLANAVDGYEIWTETYDRQASDAFVIQQEIASAVTHRIRGSFAGMDSLDGVRQAGAPASVEPEVYDLYLRGRFAWHQRTREGLREAAGYFARATALRPDYALAWVGLADAHAVRAFYDWERPRDAYPQAEAAARRAIALDPTLAAPHATLGYVLTYFQLDWAQAEAEFRRAIAADPGYSVAHQWYANLLTVAGRFAEAEREFRAAQEADPLSVIATAALGWGFHLAGKREAALAQCQRTVALAPEFTLAHLWGGMALEELGRHREARDWIGRADSLSRGSALTRLTLAHALASSGTRGGADSARAIVAEFEARRARGEYLPAYEIAKVHLALGDRSKTLRWLETTVEDRSHSRAYFGVDPQLRSIRGDAEFEVVLRSSIR